MYLQLQVLLTNAKDFKKLVIATALAAIHVLILVVSKDLGSAMIFFVTYLVMLFVSTRNPFLVLTGILAGSGAAVGAYFLFSHIRVRVQAWKDPFKDYQGGGYQICQSLFSISAGSWFGTGLCQGSPNAIPFVEQDFMFSAIAEELGTIFGICLILVCMSCFIMFVNIAMQLSNRFYRLVAVGLGSTYAAQIFLTIGGGIKLIPMTGVTLPFVSYGGSSMLSTLIMFAVVQGLYMLQRDEEKKNREKQIKEQMAAGAVYANHGYGYPNQGYAAPGYGAGGYGNYPVNSGYGSYDDGYGAAPPNGGYNGYPDAYGGYPQGGYGDDGYYDDDGYPQDGYGYDDSYGDGRPDSYENGYDDGYSYGNGGGDYEQEENRTYKDRQYGQKKGIDRRTGRR